MLAGCKLTACARALRRRSDADQSGGRDRAGAAGQLTPAIVLAVLPTFIGIASVIGFGIGVAVYGF